jgi:hypothetical protein
MPCARVGSHGAPLMRLINRGYVIDKSKKKKPFLFLD